MDLPEVQKDLACRVIREAGWVPFDLCVGVIGRRAAAMICLDTECMIHAG